MQKTSVVSKWIQYIQIGTVSIGMSEGSMDTTPEDGGAAAAGTALGEHDCNEIISFQEVAEYKDLLTLLQHLGHGITVHYNEHISKLKIIGDKNSGRSLHAPRGGEVGNIPNTVISTDMD